MCAISGIFTVTGQREDCDLYLAINKMIEIMGHRGPDDTGRCAVSINSKFSLIQNEDRRDVIGYLGFDRLSIRDLSVQGHQPMIDLSGNVVIVFNGEIYNSDELKTKYLSDMIFKSSSDTEVILNLYIQLGIKRMVELLDGMFSFCIVDTKAGKIFIARDRVGIKPLYIYKDQKFLIFASEIKAILASGFVNPEMDKAGFYETMMFGFTHQRTLLKGISEFDVGSYAVINLSNISDIYYERYWSPERIVELQNFLSYKESKRTLKEILCKAVQSQMVSDVYVGCQLSGGVDSSLITYFFGENKKNVGNKDKIKNIAFGIIPENEEQSEETYMDTVSALTGIEVDKIKLSNNWVYKEWKKAVWYCDGIPSFVNEMGIKALADEARKSNVTVLMSGEGADEVFGGYDHITDGRKVIRRFKLYKALHLNLKTFLKKHNLYDSEFCGTMNHDYYLLYSADGNFNDYVRVICPEFDLYKDEASKNRCNTIQRISSRVGMGLFEKSRCYDLAVRVAGLCNRQDKMTMAASIENRVPFLSNAVISAGLSMPEKYLCKTRLKPKQRAGKNPFIYQGKYILKDICKKIYGKNFAFRYKQGFPLPLEDFIIKFIDSDEFDDLMTKLEKRNLVDITEVKRYCEKLKNKSSYYTCEARMLWRLFSIEMFCEQFIDPYKNTGKVSNS